MSLRAVNISKILGDRQVLSGVTLKVQKGEIHGLVGENGAGKTTLMRVLAGVYQADGGEATLEGKNVFDSPPEKMRIAFVPSECELFPTMKQKGLIAFFKGIYPSFDEGMFLSLTKDLGIDKKPVRRLSTGMKMLLSVSLALCCRPDVLILDEPLAGLDVVVKRRVMTLITEQTDCAVLISSHNLQDLERIVDTVTFLIGGKVIASGDVFAVKENTFKRIQVVFSGDMPKDLIAWEGVTNVEALGRVVTVTYEGDDGAMATRLRACDVLLLERLGSTLEDAFIHGYERETAKGGK